MRWEGRRQSGNVEDRRGLSGGRKMAAGGGIGGVILIVVVMVMGGDPAQLLQLLDSTGGGQPSARPTDPAEDKLAEMVSVVLADTEDVWHKLLPAQGQTYREPQLVLFKDSVQSACGSASSAVGPFYCGGDEKVYIDLEFFEELASRFGAPGDFAQAYVIAHEVGHHIQRLTGASERVHRARNQVSEVEYNRLSVRLELQADFYAGVWAHHAQRMKNLLEAGDIDEALGAAAAIGDDRLQRQARGTVVPDSFTHGTSRQRAAWFRHGFTTGDFKEGDTFDDRQFRKISPE